MADLGKVAVRARGEWVIGVAYEMLDMVTHNLNLYIALKDTAVEPTDDGVNWQLLIEGVPIATASEAGKSKPDGKTITIDSDGTLHGASQVPEGVTYVDLQGGDSGQLPNRIPVDADTLDGHPPEYFATKKEVSELDLTQWNYRVPVDQGLEFGDDTFQYTFALAGDNKLYFYVVSDDIVTNIMKVISDGSIEFSGNIIVQRGASVKATNADKYQDSSGLSFREFENAVNTHKIVERNSNGHLVFCNSKNPFDGYIESAHVDLNGNWVFVKNITAPNITSATAELLSAQQDITEADLQNIELQQRVAQLEEKVQELSGGDSSGKTDY